MRLGEGRTLLRVMCGYEREKIEALLEPVCGWGRGGYCLNYCEAGRGDALLEVVCCGGKGIRF